MTTVNYNVGFAFPFRFDTDGKVATAGGVHDVLPTVSDLDRAVQAGVHMIAVTGKGERVMLGQFGLGAERFLFHPLGDSMISFLRVALVDQVRWFLSRAKLQDVQAISDVEEGQVRFTVRLRHAETEDESVVKFRMNRNL